MATKKHFEPREPRHHRSGSTPHALACNCYERGVPCDFTKPRSPYADTRRHLEIDPRPECRVCHEPYDLGSGVDGTCPPCQRIKSQERLDALNELRGWAVEL